MLNELAQIISLGLSTTSSKDVLIRDPNEMNGPLSWSKRMKLKDDLSCQERKKSVQDSDDEILFNTSEEEISVCRNWIISLTSGKRF